MLQFGPQIAIDIGSQNSRFYLRGQGIVKNEPTILAVDENNQILSSGSEAKNMLGRTPSDVRLIKPLIQGKITDYYFTKAFLSLIFRQIVQINFLIKPEILVSVPASATSVERTALIEAILSSGARMVHLIDQPLSAALGVQIPMAEPRGSLILSIGAGLTEISLISMGNVVAVRSLGFAGSDLSQALVEFFQKKFNLIIGQQMAEKIKLLIGSAMPFSLAEKKKLKQMDKEEILFLEGDVLSIEVSGRDEFTDLPRRVKVNVDEINQVIKAGLNEITRTVTDIMHNIPPELVTDIINKGIVMIGGTATLPHLAEFLTQKVGIPCYLADDPLNAVIKGNGQVLENLSLFNYALK